MSEDADKMMNLLSDVAGAASPSTDFAKVVQRLAEAEARIKRLERAVTTLYAVADMMKLRNMWSPFWTELEKELLELTQDVMKAIPEHKGGLR